MHWMVIRNWRAHYLAFTERLDTEVWAVAFHSVALCIAFAFYKNKMGGKRYYEKG